MTIQLSFTGSEAVTMIKKYYPSTADQKFSNGYQFLTSLMKLFNCTLEEAYQKTVNKNYAPVTKIEVTAAYHLLRKQQQLSSKINALRDKETAIKLQAHALETAPNFSAADRSSLQQHYQNSLQCIHQQIDALLDEFPVLDAEVIEPVLMTQEV